MQFSSAAVAAWSVAVAAMGPQAPSGVLQGFVPKAPPTIDGVVDLESEWSGAPAGEGLFDERSGTPALEGMRFWLAYDAKYIYFAAIVEDSQPESIRAVEYRTNASLRGDDRVGLRIDPFGNFADDHRFEINPRGATELQVPGGRANKREWQGEFQAAGRITSTGWECEARIPWAVMRLPSPGVRTLRINATRDHQRMNREYQWRDTSAGKSQNAGYWIGVEIPRVERPRTILALPYGFAGTDREGHTLDAGVDLKTKLTEQIDGVVSINPDFRNVENQILSLDFSYFERLAGESRPFFNEGQQFLGGSMRERDASLFASQRIEQFDVGAKVFGKIGESTSIGVLNTIDFGDQNAIAAQVNQSLGPRSSAYAAFSSLDSPDLGNTAGQLGISLGSGGWSVYGNHMASKDSLRGYGYRHNGGVFFRDGVWTGSLSYTEVSEFFRARLGFVPETDYKGLSGFLFYSRPFQTGPYQEFQVNGSYSDQTRISGDPYRKGGSLSGEITLRDGTQLGLRGSATRYLGFDDRSYSISVERPHGDPYNNWQIRYGWGTVGGVDFTSFGPGFAFRPNSKFQLGGSFQYFDRDGESTQTILTANYDFDEFRAVAARFVQRDSDVSFYVAFRQSGNAGNEYFLILGDPNSETFRPSLIFKAVVPLEIRF